MTIKKTTISLRTLPRPLKVRLEKPLAEILDDVRDERLWCSPPTSIRRPC
jgi:hypothetical protein